MARKVKTVFVCASCGAESPKWVGKCPKCNEWNTMNEEVVNLNSTVSTVSRSVLSATTINDISVKNEHRFITNI